MISFLILIFVMYTGVRTNAAHTHTHERARTHTGHGWLAGRVGGDGWLTLSCFITCAFEEGRERDGAALGWIAASPKRNHRISST